MCTIFYAQIASIIRYLQCYSRAPGIVLQAVFLLAIVLFAKMNTGWQKYPDDLLFQCHHRQDGKILIAVNLIWY